LKEQYSCYPTRRGEEAGDMRVRRRHSGLPIEVLVWSRIAIEILLTVLAFTSTETSEDGRLTRQFFNDCCNATSAWTTFPAGFFGGMTVKREE
jgi:hypothetical protein